MNRQEQDKNISKQNIGKFRKKKKRRYFPYRAGENITENAKIETQKIKDPDKSG